MYTYPAGGVHARGMPRTAISTLLTDARTAIGPQRRLITNEFPVSARAAAPLGDSSSAEGERKREREHSDEMSREKRSDSEIVIENRDSKIYDRRLLYC